jgi:putative ABC transport system permease protein
LALAFALIAVLAAGGIELPGSGIVVQPSTALQGIVMGTLITMLSVATPARRAAKAEPVEALRQAASEQAAISRRRGMAAALCCGLGALAMLFGPAALIALGAVVLFVGVIIAGPSLAVLAARLTRPLLSRVSLESRLAADNSARNPKRTATTSNALLIGVFLVTLVTVAGTSIKDFVVQEINKLSSADYTIESTGGTIDDQLVADLRAIDGVEDVVPFRREAVTIDGAASTLSTGDIAALVEVADLKATTGSIDDLGPGKVAVIEEYGTERQLGSRVVLQDSAGDTATLEVVAVLKGSIDTYSIGNLVDQATFDGFVGDTAPTVAFIRLVTGVQSDTKDAIEARTQLRPDISIIEGNALGQLLGRVFDFLISAVNGLLMMSVVVALIGIINTMSLSILERRRELGLLRVVGMVDRRVRRMVRVESVIVAALGTLGGLAVGTFMGFALVNGIDRLSGANISLSLPFMYLTAVLVLGIALGFLAALIPARRSTRLDVLDAIQAV